MLLELLILLLIIYQNFKNFKNNVINVEIAHVLQYINDNLLLYLQACLYFCQSKVQII